MSGRGEAGSPRVLLVEDEVLIAMDLEQWLTELGFEVVGPFRRSEDALRALGQGRIDFAILDYLLGDENSGCVAERLTCMRVPYVFLTGCHEVLLDNGRAAPKLEKPMSRRQMGEALRDLCAPTFPCGCTG